MKEVRSITVRELPTCSKCSHAAELHALPGAGVYGRKYARAFLSRLREILCADGDSFGKPADEEFPKAGGAAGSDSGIVENERWSLCPGGWGALRTGKVRTSSIRCRC